MTDLLKVDWLGILKKLVVALKLTTNSTRALVMQMDTGITSTGQFSLNLS